MPGPLVGASQLPPSVRTQAVAPQDGFQESAASPELSEEQLAAIAQAEEREAAGEAVERFVDVAKPRRVDFARPCGGTLPSDAGNVGNGKISIKVSDIAKDHGVGFGTSGIRGEVTKLTDLVCYTYTAAFLEYLEKSGQIKRGSEVAIGGDLRQSTPRIMATVAQAIRDRGYYVSNQGLLSSPALAHYGFARRIPSIMVTGSHIPADRNGIKFVKGDGEVLKPDEARILDQTISIPDKFAADGSFKSRPDQLPKEDKGAFSAETIFDWRYRNFFGPFGREVFVRPDGRNLNVGVYLHSAVGGLLLSHITGMLGANVTGFSRSDEFVPVDTEAIDPRDVALAAEWAATHSVDAIITTDGDSDRPMIAGADGRWLRGDVLGILVAKFLNADAVVTPVSSNTALEDTMDWTVVRTRIGSPYVIAEMMQLGTGGSRVVGYEANGGFLTASPFSLHNSPLAIGPLPTRDAFLPLLSMLYMISAGSTEPVTIADLLAGLPQRFTASNRLKNFPLADSARLMGAYAAGRPQPEILEGLKRWIGPTFGDVNSVDFTDGLRVTLADGRIVHFRPSGNAPEMRVYAESTSEADAAKMVRQGLGLIPDEVRRLTTLAR